MTTLTAGTLFGFGLSLSGMVDPARVRGFLDPFGAWDPSLAFVLVGAVAVAAISVFLAHRMRRPLLDKSFHLPTANSIDARLIGGSALFGVGWGLGGLCPGPAIAALSTGAAPIVLFIGAMLVGMIAHDRLVPGKSG